MNWWNLLMNIAIVESCLGIGASIVAIVLSIVNKDFPLGYLGSIFIAVCIWLLFLLRSKKTS